VTVLVIVIGHRIGYVTRALEVGCEQQIDMCGGKRMSKSLPVVDLDMVASEAQYTPANRMTKAMERP